MENFFVFNNRNGQWWQSESKPGGHDVCRLDRAKNAG
jgi:hypothetical protein